MKIITQLNFFPPLVVSLVVGLLTAQRRHFVVDALRMINLDAPVAASQGDTIQLSCSYSLGSPTSETATSSDHQNPELKPAKKSEHQSKQTLAPQTASSYDNSLPEVLYAIKWYKDGREFFRYLAQSHDRKQAFNMDGLLVDVEKSDNHTVELKNISLKTSGLFKCEVSTDAPSFTTKYIERRMLVHYPPSEGPTIKTTNGWGSVVSTRKKELLYSPGSAIQLTCVTAESKPAASIDWIINDTLNLTSLSPLNGARPLFEMGVRRSVQLPTTNAANQVRAVGSGSLGPLMGQRTARYEVLNDSTLIVADFSSGQGASPTINLPHSLDHLLESTSSQLNFTIEANFFEVLSRYTNSRNRPSNGHSPDINQIDKIGVSSESTPRFRSSRGANLTVRKPKKRPQPTGANDKLRLEIKCIARVLHLVMSDEIKLRHTDKARGVVDSSATNREPDSTKQLWRVRGNSGAPRIGLCDSRLAYLILSLALGMFLSSNRVTIIQE